MEPSDQVLVARVIDGDRNAFRTLMDRHHPACARFAVRMLGQREDAEDAVQETFVRVYRALGTYHERERFRSWLFRILVNQCRSGARRRTRRDRWLQRERAERAAAVAAPPEGDADLRDALQQALDRIEPRLREAFLLHYGEGLDYAEIASLTGAGVSALKMRVKRARDAMRPYLEAMLHE